MKNKPLTVEVVDGEIRVSIGVETLAYALEHNGEIEGYRATDADKFSTDVLRELNKEQEDGTTPVHLLFDKAIDGAINNGSEWVELITVIKKTR